MLRLLAISTATARTTYCCAMRTGAGSIIRWTGVSILPTSAGYADLTRNLAWQFAGIGDLNGDGKDDVLVRHTDGRWFYYPMDGRYHITGERGLAGLTRNLDWHVAGMGDLNGDGKDDVLLRNKNGRWYYYPMNGRRYITDARGYADLTRDLDWQVAGIGDLNGDGKDDVLLRHTDGRWDYYPMDGRNPIADQRGLAGLTRNLDWQVAGMGDLNGDGRDDVLLRHTDSRWYYYPMNGRRFLTDARGYAGLTRNLDWQVAGIGDLNGDGRDDVLLRHEDSRWYYYPMNGRRYLADARGYANLTRNPDWSIAAADTLAPTGAPDLVVESPSVNNSTLNTGDSFTLNATVRNRGTGRADATTLRYYRSSDSTISSSDTQTGTDAVGGLAASGSDDKSTTLTAPSNAGTWYYGACVDAVSGESDTGNNCSSGVRVTVNSGTGPTTPPGGTSRDCADCPEMVSIPGGSFRMGNLSGEQINDQEPVHSVTVPAFRLGKYEVTFAQWDACVADGGCGGYRPDDRGRGRGNRSVIQVSWDDSQLFIDWLNARTGGRYRLPTEAEWEYAARAGSTTEYSWGNDIGRNRANCYVGSCRDSYDYTAPVGSFPANAWGLHDMHGNVWEWVQDCWHDNYEGAPNDGSAWISNCAGGSYNDERGRRVVRGGSWNDNARLLRSAYRDWLTRPARANFFGYGFRVAQDN